VGSLSGELGRRIGRAFSVSAHATTKQPQPILWPDEPVDLNVFAQKCLLFFPRPPLNTYDAKRADLLAMAKDLFEVVLHKAVMAVKIERLQDISADTTRGESADGRSVPQ
jgi:hypothetical protein